MNFTDCQSISIIEFLRSLGMEPVEKCHDYYKYFAPGRDEKHPSFVVYVNKNDWYDFGTAKGGDIGNLVQYLYQCDASKALSILNDYALKNPFSPCSLHIPIKNNENEPGESAVQITDIRGIHHWHLKSYLNERRIPLVLAEKYLKEVHYITRSGTRMHSLGFRNDKGGYVLRHKGQGKPHNTKPQWITTIPGTRNNELVVFEGFFNFLSFLVYYQLQESPVTTVVLNSVSNLGKLLPEIGNYNRLHLYLDNDEPGHTKLAQIQAVHHQAEDHSEVYSKVMNKKTGKYCNDFNEMLCLTGS